MQQFRSYVAAAVVIVAIVVCVAWVVSAQPGAFPGLQTVGLYKYEAVPIGANGPLKDCVVCHSVEPGGPLHEASNLWNAFFNPTYWPSLLPGAGVCTALAGVWALITSQPN